MLKPYHGIRDWSRDQLEQEIENLQKDKLNGVMNEVTYRTYYDIVLTEILRKEDIDEQYKAYDRAMRGV